MPPIEARAKLTIYDKAFFITYYSLLASIL